jgi:hypothetical protein
VPDTHLPSKQRRRNGRNVRPPDRIFFAAKASAGPETRLWTRHIVRFLANPFGKALVRPHGEGEFAGREDVGFRPPERRFQLCIGKISMHL